MDVVAPPDGENLPTIVLVHGGPIPFDGRRQLQSLATALADRGAVVFLTTYRSSATGNGQTDSLADLRCAVSYARTASPDYGGSPDRVVYVGHSFGSNLGLQLAISPNADASSCLGSGVSVPDAVVAIAGFLVTMTGAADTAPPMSLVGASDDTVALGGAATAERLREAGFDARYTEVGGVDHFTVVDPALNPAIVDLVFESVPAVP
jgi:acetyl esterase/lipase